MVPVSIDGPVAQRIERRFPKSQVDGSSPSGAANHFGYLFIAKLIEVMQIERVSPEERNRQIRTPQKLDVFFCSK